MVLFPRGGRGAVPADVDAAVRPLRGDGRGRGGEVPRVQGARLRAVEGVLRPGDRLQGHEPAVFRGVVLTVLLRLGGLKNSVWLVL